MAEVRMIKRLRRRIRHRGRASQVPIYLGKQIRFFIYQSDWKVLPMAAIIAALVSMVIRRDFFLTMEGNLKGAFALTCVAIWNGCFNSIQSICRERPIIKREHRSGMHISSYVVSHMIYQFALCLAQTGLSVYVMQMMGVTFPTPGFLTRWMILDVGVSMLLISYASDMLSLFISSVAHTTTGAMTVMPFVLIFQLVFSGGLLPLPDWTRPLANYTISNYGIKVIAAQSGYNEAPMVTAWNTLYKMRDNEIGGTITLGQILDLLGDEDNAFLDSREDMEIIPSFTVGAAAKIFAAADEILHVTDREIIHALSLRETLTALLQMEGLEALWSQVLVPGTEGVAAVTAGDMLESLLADERAQAVLDQEVGSSTTLGEILEAFGVEETVQEMQDERINQAVTLGEIREFLVGNEALEAYRDRAFTFRTTVGDLLDLFGEENVQTVIQEKTAAASYNPDYDRTARNVLRNWMMLMAFGLAFAALATISLELIDRDKR